MADAAEQRGNVAELGRHRRTRSFQTGPVGPLETIRTRLGLSMDKFSEALGYSSATYAEWARAGAAPRVAALAAECLMRRQAQDASGPTYLVRTVKGVPLVALVDASQTATTGGRRYLLVEDAQ